jgi:hypothetical protein
MTIQSKMSHYKYEIIFEKEKYAKSPLFCDIYHKIVSQVCPDRFMIVAVKV